MTSSEDTDEGHGETTSDARYEDRFRIFFSLFAIAILAHLLNKVDFSLVPSAFGWEALTAWLTLIGALSVLYRPGSVRAVLLMSGAQITHVLATMPEVADHWYLSGFMGVLAFIAYVRRGMFEEGETNPRVMKDLEPAARIVFLVTYAAAALAKYNVDFLDPQTSCSVELFGHILTSLGAAGVPSWLQYPIVWGTILTETFVALLLLSRYTRRWAILLGLAFHSMLAFTPAVRVFDFTAMLVPCLFLFTPLNCTDELRRIWNDVVDPSSPPDMLPDHVRWHRLLVVFTIGLCVVFQDELFSPIQEVVPVLAFDVYHAVVFAMACMALLGGDEPVRWPDSFYRMHLPSYGVCLLIVVLNVASPYIGLKTESAFTMFSNLRTAGEASNHLLLSRYSLFSFQDDPVTIHHSTDESLQGFADRNQQLVFFELRRYVGLDAGDDRIVFERHGEIVQVEQASKHPSLSPPPWILQKLLIFRPVTSPSRCPISRKTST